MIGVTIDLTDEAAASQEACRRFQFGNAPRHGGTATTTPGKTGLAQFQIARSQP